MIHSAFLIFNPVSGKGNPEQDLSTIKQIIESEIKLEVLSTTEEVGAEQLAQEAIEKGAECIIASGGDGTLSQVAGVLVEKDIPLGIIPRGTANAFANALNIPESIEAACKTILAGNQRVIDMGQCEGKAMMLLAGIGFEAETVEDANREAKNRFGMLAYVLSGLKQLQELGKFEAELETDDEIIKVEAAAITVANVAPPSSILAQGPSGIVMDDGLLDVTIVSPKSRAGAIAASYHLLQSAFHEDGVERDDIGYFRTARIKIKTDPPQKVVLDGEIIGKTPIEVHCLPQKLTIFVPDELAPEPEQKLEGLPGLEIQSKGNQESNSSSPDPNQQPDVLVVDARIPDQKL